ncbi:hypothetical protein V5O48_009063 [Marasmius crinis-equi]|uniref:Uncharacterized protein n=1 Tax=Marasmius crinis-equi TaxID=585013 RepID=A0ABR3FCN6_9AGAR
MPRPKRYKNKEERRIAACDKAKRHYHKNKEAINAKKKEARLQHLRDIECAITLRRELEERQERQRQRQKHVQTISDANWHSQLVNDSRFYDQRYAALKKKLLQNILQGNPRKYFENIYELLISATGSEEPVSAHLETARGAFEYRMGQEQVKALWSQAWNAVGSGPILDKFTLLSEGFHAIEHALNDLEVAVLEERLVDRHKRGAFMYQSSTFLKQFEDLP